MITEITRASDVVGTVDAAEAAVGAAASARPSESTTLAVTGITRAEKGGTIAIQATIRTDASR